MNLTWPIVPKMNSKVQHLIHSVDRADGLKYDRDIGRTYITAYRDRFEVTKKFLHILPAYIAMKYDNETTNAWIDAEYWQKDGDYGVTFHQGHDEAGNYGWNGTWTTQEDAIYNDILQEEMGNTTFNIEGLELLNNPVRASTTTDDLSFASHANFGRPATEEDHDSGAAASTNAAPGVAGSGDTP